MMSPIEHFLTDFSPLAGEALFPWSPPGPTQDDDELPMADDDSLDFAIEEARRAGAAEATAAAEALHAAAEEAMRAAYEQQRAADRQLWAETEGAALAQLITEGLESLETRVANTAAVVLKWLLSEQVGQKALADLRAAIQSLLIGGEGRPILVTGRADLVEALRASFSFTTAVTFEPGDAADVVIQTGDTMIQSALASWAERLAAELGAAR